MQATCPVCNGTCRQPADTFGASAQYARKNGWYGYDKETDTVDCRNCGSQYMWSKPTGMVRTRPDGTACEHSYTSKTVGRCLTEYTCTHCGDRYQIDSSD